MPSERLKKGLPFIHGRIIIGRRGGGSGVLLRGRRARGRAGIAYLAEMGSIYICQAGAARGRLGQGNAHTQRCLCKAKVAWPRVPPSRGFSLALTSGIHNVSLLFPAAPSRTLARLRCPLDSHSSGFICCYSSSISDSVAVQITSACLSVIVIYLGQRILIERLI